MSTTYKNSQNIPNEVLADRLEELSNIVSKNHDRIQSEFTMSVPAELDRDADLVMAEAARRLRSKIVWQLSIEKPQYNRDIIATYRFEQFDIGFYSSVECSDGWCDFSFVDENGEWVAPNYWIYADEFFNNLKQIFRR